MILVAALFIILVAPSRQLTVHQQSLGLRNLVKRATTGYILKPKEVYFCSLKAKFVYARRSACERIFELQEKAQHCASRRLLIMRIDHQLAYLQRMVLLPLLDKAKQRAQKCNDKASNSTARINELKADIALLQEQHINNTSHQSKLICVPPNLKQVKDNLTESIGERKAIHKQMKHSLGNLTEKLEGNNAIITNFSLSATNYTKVIVKTPLNTFEFNSVQHLLRQAGDGRAELYCAFTTEFKRIVESTERIDAKYNSSPSRLAK